MADNGNVQKLIVPDPAVSVFPGPRGFNLARFKTTCAYSTALYLPLSLAVSRSFDVYSRGGRAWERSASRAYERHLRRIIQSSRRPKKRANGPEPINAFDNVRLNNCWKGNVKDRCCNASDRHRSRRSRRSRARSPPLIKARLVSSIYRFMVPRFQACLALRFEPT